MVKAAGIDPEELVEGAIRFAWTGGGIFIDMAIGRYRSDAMVFGNGSCGGCCGRRHVQTSEFKEAGDDEIGAAMYKCATEPWALCMWEGRLLTGIMWRRNCGDRRYASYYPEPEESVYDFYDKNGAVKESCFRFPREIFRSVSLEKWKNLSIVCQPG